MKKNIIFILNMVLAGLVSYSAVYFYYQYKYKDMKDIKTAIVHYKSLKTSQEKDDFRELFFNSMVNSNKTYLNAQSQKNDKLKLVNSYFQGKEVQFEFEVGDEYKQMIDAIKDKSKFKDADKSILCQGFESFFDFDVTIKEVFTHRGSNFMEVNLKKEDCVLIN